MSWYVDQHHSRFARAVAAYGLPGTSLALPDRPLDDREWLAFMREVRTQRITGLLVQAMCDEALPLTDDQWDEAGAAHFEAVDQCLQLERMLVSVVTMLSQAGIDHRVLKGPALAGALPRSVDADLRRHRRSGALRGDRRRRASAHSRWIPA